MIAALLWDVDGTLAETERDGHRVAFNLAFAALGLPWQWDEAHYGTLLRITGGRERLLADMRQRALLPLMSQIPPLAAEREALALELHRRKNALYGRLVAEGAIPLREGVRELVEEAAARGVRQAIVTTTSRVNVEALLQRHFAGARHFETLVCGEDVAHKKPDPQAHQRALAVLGVAPRQALALEDAPAGAAAACAAEVPVLVTRSAYFANEPVEGVLAVGPGLHQRTGWWPEPLPREGAPSRITLDDLVDWHARMEQVSQFG